MKLPSLLSLQTNRWSIIAVVASVTLVILGLVTVYSPPLQPPLSINIEPDSLRATDLELETSITEPTVELQPPIYTNPMQPVLTTVTVRDGDNLSTILQKHDIPISDLNRLLQSGEPGSRLRRLFVNDELKFRKNSAGELVTFEYIPNRRIRFRFVREGNDFEVHELIATEDWREKYVHVSINQGESPISAGLRAGIKQEETILDMTQILEWEIDFWHDIRAGDNYQILYRELYLDSEYEADGSILALRFVNRKRTYQAIRFESTDGSTGYYTPDGTFTQKQFLRAPLVYTRISSSFNPKRLHPILGVVRPHNGIDYAAPIGTPVRSTGDGVVVTAAYTRNNGNYVVVDHTSNYQTKYLHLSKIARGIKNGTSVKQGQLLGTVGMTGMATGPHLHYEFLIDKKHINPGRLVVPQTRRLEGVALTSFKNHAQQVEKTMELHHRQWVADNPVVASNR